MSENPDGIRVEGLTVRYGQTTALENATVTIRPGRVTGLIGTNGSGKSTLLNSIVGRIRPASGTVRIDGRSPSSARQRNLIGYVPQTEAVDREFPVSVRDVVMMGRYGHQGFTRRVRPADREAVDRALERVDLAELAERQIGALSGGQLKRTFVARCLAQEAVHLLLDEPFAGVDKASERTITRVLRDLADDGHTIVVSSHDLGALPELADDGILLQRRVLFQGQIAEVLQPDRLALAFGIDIAGGAS